MSQSLCRACLTEIPAAVDACPACGSTRLARHPELFSLTFAHVDCDAFYASIEKRDRPDLRDKPLLIGGGQRGVVATACYIARRFGPHSAMPMYKALRLCPDAVVLRPDMPKYAAVSRQIRGIFETYTPLVEFLSLDEAFLDLSGCEDLFGESAAAILARIQARVREEAGIGISIGLSYNKFLAKMASDLDKPEGFAVIGRSEARDFLAPRPVRDIPGVGEAFARRLFQAGYKTIADLQAVSETRLAQQFGALGRALAQRARGTDPRRVTPHREAKSISAETTFDTDIASLADLERRLWPLCEKVAARCKKSGAAGESVVLKLKTARFQTLTRSRRLPDPTQMAETIWRHARPLLAREADGRAFRLIGIGVADLCDPARADPPDLFDTAQARAVRAERAIDTVRDRFGTDAIGRRSFGGDDAEPDG
ncbi:DNA polymerase IV [Caenispirillum salinarum AK4]|uniref:DNA polymerase IV n=1 Tax=Caenispirillum salinarum AK4 TaxID=1238182 RepID=K9GYZ5_9PROT|nr:DNA polymerase IV [Caenispirillum salinarum]EKV30522.1 DNA polymerase IV [Caenispirillum salinarum AK4]